MEWKISGGAQLWLNRFGESCCCPYGLNNITLFHRFCRRRHEHYSGMNNCWMAASALELHSFGTNHSVSDFRPIWWAIRFGIGRRWKQAEPLHGRPFPTRPAGRWYMEDAEGCSCSNWNCWPPRHFLRTDTGETLSTGFRVWERRTPD